MKESEIQKYIGSCLETKLLNHGFVFFVRNRNGEKNIVFRKIINDVIFEYSVNFMKFGDIDLFFLVSFNSLTELYRKIDESFNDENYYLFKVKIKKLLNPKNINGVYFSGVTDKFPLSSLIADGIELDRVCEHIYKNFFANCIPNLIDKLGTITNADILLNSSPVVYEQDGKPRLWVYSTSFVDQALNGVLIAYLSNNPKKKDIFDAYLAYSEKFEEGEIKEIDILRKSIKQFLGV